MELKPTEYMNSQWDKINEVRRQFQDFINYEWNYAVHLSFHKHYKTSIENTNKLVRAYLKDLRKVKKVVFSAFYVIPKSFVDPDFKPNHIHILLLIYNEKERMRILLNDSTTKFHQINKCVVHKLDMPESGFYVTKFKNLKLTDLDTFYFDFYREQLLQKYRNQTDYIGEQFIRASQRNGG